MLGLVLAVSNAPAMFRPRQDWKTIYDSQTTEGIPPPNELEQETDAVADEHAARFAKGFETLSGQLEQYQPEAVVVLGYDDGTCFSGAQVPQFCTYTGDEITGTTAIAVLGEKPEEHMATLPCLPNFAWEIQTSLVDRGFDVNYMTIQNPLGNPENGTTSAFTRPVSKLLAGMNVPIVPIFINCHVEPTPTGHRCYDFGLAVAAILEESPLRTALLSVGGLSNDPNGARAGWVDNRLDNFVLTALGKGDTRRLRTMFDLDSDTLRGGTGQVRTWIAAGAAGESKGGRGTVVDYIPSMRAMTGIGFAYWRLS